MPPKADLPRRPEEHSRSTWSTRAFASVLPRHWLVHLLEEDVGIDRRVEVFEGGHTTGIFFNVQLKSTQTGSGQHPAESIKRTTLNYWKQTPDATLVVIAHDPTETLWYRWAHLLPYDSKPNTKSRQVRCETVLDEQSAASLAEEARAWRLARDISRHLPIDLHLTGGVLYGQSAAPLKRSISQKLATLPSFVRVVHSNPRLPYLRVSIEDDKVMAGVRGDAMRQITWGLHGARDHGALASDVIAALALSLAAVGAEDLCVRFLKIAAPQTHTLLEANGLGYAVALLTRHDASDTVLTLIHRAAARENHPARDIALAAFRSSDPGPELRRAVAHAIRDAARGWERPAMGTYNAANTLSEKDADEALRLYEEAAVADPEYRTRGYWWREKGVVHWSRDDVAEAEQCYEKAIEYGDFGASAYLADVLMRTGRYREARDAFLAADIWSSPEGGAQWRLSCNALEYIVKDLGIEKQERSSRSSPEFFHADTEDVEALKDAAMAAIRKDALNAWAHLALASVYEAAGDQSIFAATAAAVIVNLDPHLWMNLLRESYTDTTLKDQARAAIAQDAMLCAWKYFGPSFADFISDEELIRDDEVRTGLLEFFELLRPATPPMEMRQHSDSGGYKSFFIPTDPRAAS